MSSQRVNVLLVLIVLVAAGAGTFLGWQYATRPSRPSSLMTEGDLMSALRTHVLEGDYLASGQSEHSKNDPVQGRFERTLECKAVHNANAPFDQKMVSQRLERWIGNLVQVDTTADGPAGPAEWCRVIRYTGRHTTGELRYTLKPVPGADFVLNGKTSTGNIQALEIQIAEQSKR